MTRRLGLVPLFRLLALFAAALFWTQGAAARDLPDFTGLVEKVSPSVVNISTTPKPKAHRKMVPHDLELPDGSPFGEWFKRFFGEDGDTPDFDAKSLGSGFIISADGYILTNNHVVKEADEVMVRLPDRRELKAEVVGADERSDVALLKVDAKGLPMVKIGSSKEAKVGEWVLAIGTPFGFDHSVTAGIISAKGRSLPNENYVPFIQTDVAINPGNSGGPLLNLDGEVIGVNSQIYSRTGGYMGLSFAIPIEMAMEVVDQLKTTGKVSRGWLGVLIQDVTQELAESFGMDKPHGALVSKVLPDSPAAKAGFKVGDIITRFGDYEVEHSVNLPPIVGRTKVGGKVAVEVLREGKSRNLSVEIGELPEEENLAMAEGEGGGGVSGGKLGVVVTDIPADQRDELGIPEGGVVVKKVEDGPAARAGIHPGDVITMLNGVPVKGAGQFRDLAKELPAGKPVPILVQRDGGPLFLALKIAE